MRLCALIGNGFSMTYSGGLAIPALTQELEDAFKDLGGEEAAEALKALPSTLVGAAREDFEALLSPFEFGAQAMAHLRALSPLVPDPAGQTATSLQRVRTFLRRTHQLGLGLSLDAIDRHSAVTHDGHYDDTVMRLVRAISKPEHLPLRVFTPNYDNLLHSGFLWNDSNLSDLADGRNQQAFDLAGDSLHGRPIRLSHGELMATQVTLVNLHGSLNWLGDPATGSVFKFTIDDLRYLGASSEGYWTLLREDKVDMLPSVVLTDRKAEVVREWPFSLAYEIMETSFAECDHWLIAGFSFGDEAINAAMQRAAMQSGKRPACLVLGHGDREEVKRRARRAMGRRPTLYVDGGGLPDSIEGSEWQRWEGART